MKIDNEVGVLAALDDTGYPAPDTLPSGRQEIIRLAIETAFGFSRLISACRCHRWCLVWAPPAMESAVRLDNWIL